MKILLAPDAFKGSLTAERFCETASGTLAEHLPDATTIALPLSDGGEGLSRVLAAGTGGWVVSCRVSDPLERPVLAHYGLSGDGRRAFVELAAASGLPLLATRELDLLRASTRGTGELVADALGRGCDEIVLGLGGSATNDAGKGALEALGVSFLDARGKRLAPGGGSLEQLARVETGGVPEPARRARFLLACDVRNPLTGPGGASAVFGPQKGASPAMVRRLEAALERFAEVVGRTCGVESLGSLEGGGAAGGTAAGFHAFLGAEIRAGFDLVSEILDLEGLLERERPDLVVTGEGCLDRQTAQGKLPARLAALCGERGIPCVAVVGAVSCSAEEVAEMGLAGAHALTPGRFVGDELRRLTEQELARQLPDIVGCYLRS